MLMTNAERAMCEQLAVEMILHGERMRKSMTILETREAIITLLAANAFLLKLTLAQEKAPDLSDRG